MKGSGIAWLWLICLTLSALRLHSQPREDVNDSLEEGFRNPPTSARPKALWPWLNGNVSLGQITYEMEEAHRKGMGGFDIWDIGVLVDPDNVIPPGPAFLSDPSLHAIAHAIREGDRLGLEIGLTFASSWNAGGSWVKPRDGAMGLFRSDTVVTGPSTFSAVLPFPLIPDKYGNRPVIQFRDPTTGLPHFYKEVAVLAHPLTADSVISAGKIEAIPLKKNRTTWRVPAGKWRIVRYVCAPTGQPLAIPSPNSRGLMLDHFSAQAQKNNLDYIFGRLLPVTGPLQNRSLKYLYADSYEVNSAVWTPLLPEEFRKRKGYSLEEYLPVFDGFAVVDKETSSRFLFDFRKTLSDLIIENHYRLGTQICNQNGTGFCAEAGGPGQPIHNVPFEDLKALGSVTIPRGEFWNKHPQLDMLQVVKGVASAAHIYDQKWVEAESFTSVWLWQEGPDELKPLADRALCEGLNRFVYHTFPHTPPESGDPGWVYNFGTLINTTNGWWSKSGAFHRYLARCSYLLQQGDFVGDVAFYYGDEAPNFTGPKKIHEGLGFGYDYDVVNTEILLTRMEVRDGRIVLPHGQSYAVLVLPPEKSINPDVLEKLEKMVRSGAVIIGPRPQFATGLARRDTNDERVRKLANMMWGGIDSVQVKEHSYGNGKVIWGRSVREVLNDQGVTPDLYTPSEVQGNLDWIHRATQESEIYFIRNNTGKPVEQAVTFRVGNKSPQLWNPENGEIVSVPVYEKSGINTTIPLYLAGYESIFVVFKSDSKPPISGLSLNGIKISGSSIPSGARLRFTRHGILTSTGGKWSWNQGGKPFVRTTKEHSALTLGGPWILRFDQTKGGPARDTLRNLFSLHESDKESVRYYSGIMTYEHTFSIDKKQLLPETRIMLDLGEVREVAEVYVNGLNVGTVWHAPFRLDVTEAIKEGENSLVIEVVNTINNRLVGDARLPERYRQTSSNVKRLPNAWMKPFAEAALLKSGMIGPVRIHFFDVLAPAE